MMRLKSCLQCCPALCTALPAQHACPSRVPTTDTSPTTRSALAPPPLAIIITDINMGKKTKPTPVEEAPKADPKGAKPEEKGKKGGKKK